MTDLGLKINCSVFSFNCISHPLYWATTSARALATFWSYANLTLSRIVPPDEYSVHILKRGLSLYKQKV